MKTPKAKKLPSGSWCCRVMVNKQAVCITKPTKKEAEAEALRIKLGDKRIPTSYVTLTDAVNQYIDSRRNVCSPSTVRGYVTIRDHRFPELMHMDVNSLTQDDCQRAVDHARKNYSAKTVCNSWRFLSSVIEYTTGHKIKVSLPQVIKKEREWLTPQQIDIFVAAVHGERVEIAALFALCSLRESEILDIKWSDIDLKKRTARISGAAVPDENHKLVHKKENKNTASCRTIPLIPPLVKALEADRYHGEYVVTMSANGIYKAIRRICRANGLPSMGPHGLRHSFASLAYHLGLDEKTTMQLGGWSDDRTMRAIYTHIAQQDVETAAQKLLAYYDPASRKKK